MKLKLIQVKDYDEMTETLLGIFKEQIQTKPDSVLSFTTGGTPRGLLERLAEEINDGLDISRCVFCNLDEYVGKKQGIYSVYHFMNEHLYDRINIRPREIHMMDAEAEDFEKELSRYRGVLDEHPRQIQLLGLGTNGHIGANEPGTPFDSTLFVADSCQSTIRSTRELFGLTEEETPVRMFTMGFKEIMAADCVVLAASGKSKAEAVKKVIEDGISEQVPASYLKNHDNFIFIIDEDAASLLER